MTDTSIVRASDTTLEFYPPLPVAVDQVVIARNPQEMRDSQEKLIEWAKAKCIECGDRLAEIGGLRDAAKAAGQSITGYAKLIRESEDGVRFYDQMRLAFEAGYCIVPNFPVDVIAVRVETDREAFFEPNASSAWGRPRMHEAQPDKLLPGDGRFVDPVPRGEYRKEEIEVREGRKETRHIGTPVAWREVSFPAKLARRELIENLSQATRERVFDDIGILPERRKRHPDPMLIGRIHSNPGRPNNRTVSFLIAWWIDTRTL